MEENKENSLYGQFALISSSGVLLTYSFLEQNLQIGQLVCVPLKQGTLDKICIAVYLNICEKPKFECRSIHSICSHTIVLKKEQMNLLRRMALYYLTPLEWCLRLVAPGFLWDVAKIATVQKYFSKLNEENVVNPVLKLQDDSTPRENNTAQNDNTSFEHQSSKVIHLNPGQKKAYEFILQNITQTILLHGVTGSGKTEVYLKLAQHIISLGKKILILVPEISLTPQMTARFKYIFSDQLSVLHSGISPTALIKEWLNVYHGKSRVVLGVRSAIFCPLSNIGLIVVDEEHDQSYKCAERPCYNARDMAVLRANMEGACCLLGSATPSLESFWNTQLEKYKYVELADKHAASTQVETQIFESTHRDCQIVPGIMALIEKNHANHFQTMVLLNRRGFVNYALCSSCRTPLTCPHCSVATTIHNFGRREVCHYCDFNREIRTTCPQCLNTHFILKGVGTQNIEAYLQAELPNLRVERLDRDSLTSQTKLIKILNRFKQHEIDCLVGTQMLAKGHDFSNVTLIVILNLEDGLFLPDFRASERTFHLLTQAMGRVGRGKHNGTVALQSVIKSHPVVDLALKKNITQFLERELANRKRAGLPPFSRLILIEIKHTQRIVAEKYAIRIKNECLEFWKQKAFKTTDIFLSGHYDAPIEKINRVYRLHICLHTTKTLQPHQCIPESIYASSQLRRVLKIDVDPQNFL